MGDTAVPARDDRYLRHGRCSASCAGWLRPGGLAALGLEVAEYASGRTLPPYQAALARRLGAPRRLRELPSALAAPLGALLLGSAFLARHIVLDRWFLGAGRMPYAPARTQERADALRRAS